MSSFPGFIVHEHIDIADGLRALQNFRGISNEELEHLTGLTRGHVDKMLGPSRTKAIGKSSLGWILRALGGQFVLMRDLQQEAIMRARWQGRNSSQVRVNAHPLSIVVLRRAVPVIFANYSRKGALARLAKIPAEKRSKIARRAAKARWHRNKRKSVLTCVVR
jgi:hypothetical protein